MKAEAATDNENPNPLLSLNSMVYDFKNLDITFFISEDWYFCSHRLPIARGIIEHGGNVTLITRVDRYGEKIKKENIRLIPLKRFKRRIQSPLLEFFSFLECLLIYRRESPKIVHQVALKPVIYGTIAARLVGVKNIVNAFAGMGSLFISEKSNYTLRQKIFLLIFRLLFKSKNVRLILQNDNDLNLLLKYRVVNKDQVVLIRGSGVDLQLFKTTSEPPGKPVVLLPSRMLWDKGVGEFVEAAKLLNNRKKIARFVLVGAPDPDNPRSIDPSRIHKWVDAGWVEWWGHRRDMPHVYARSHIVCLPSYYREGLPKVLLEAAASCRAIITSDTVGCRDVVKHGENGLLVPSRNATELADSILYLLIHPEVRKCMGIKGRKMVERGFSQEKSIGDTIDFYQSILNNLP